MEEQVKCAVCAKTFKEQKSLDMHFNAKHSEPKQEAKPVGLTKKQFNYLKLGIGLIAIILIIGGLFYLLPSVKPIILPPTSMDGHIEVSPTSHVLKEPMQLEVQKHMLEHSDGMGAPGIIINYNCIDFKCNNNLISSLEAFAGKYNNVYVAPFKGMTVKIALTKLNKIQTLDEFNESAIELFINQ